MSVPALELQKWEAVFMWPGDIRYGARGRSGTWDKPSLASPCMCRVIFGFAGDERGGLRNWRNQPVAVGFTHRAMFPNGEQQQFRLPLSKFLAEGIAFSLGGLSPTCTISCQVRDALHPVIAG